MHHSQAFSYKKIITYGHSRSQVTNGTIRHISEKTMFISSLRMEGGLDLKWHTVFRAQSVPTSNNTTRYLRPFVILLMSTSVVLKRGRDTLGGLSKFPSGLQHEFKIFKKKNVLNDLKFLRMRSHDLMYVWLNNIIIINNLKQCLLWIFKSMITRPEKVMDIFILKLYCQALSFFFIRQKMPFVSEKKVSTKNSHIDSDIVIMEFNYLKICKLL